eukprot:3617568-Rhodomonas_salina.2
MPASHAMRHAVQCRRLQPLQCAERPTSANPCSTKSLLAPKHPSFEPSYSCAVESSLSEINDTEIISRMMHPRAKLSSASVGTAVMLVR